MLMRWEFGYVEQFSLRCRFVVSWRLWITQLVNSTLTNNMTHPCTVQCVISPSKFKWNGIAMNSHYQSSWTNTASKTETVSLMVKSWWGRDSGPEIIIKHMVLQSRLHWLHISSIQASTKTLLAKALLCSQTPQVDLSENIEFDTQIQFWGYIRYILVYHGIPHLQTPYHSFCCARR